MSATSNAVLAQRAADVAGISGTDDSLLITWRDGTTTMLAGTTGIAFAEGRIVFGGATPAARALRAYEAILGFTPEAGAVAGTAKLRAGGISMTDVTASLLGTATWKARVAGLGTAQQIRLIYEDVIGYAPSAGAMEYLLWANSVGVSMAGLAAMLIDTPQAAAHSEAEHPAGIWLVSPTQRSIVQAYDAALDQVPDQAALARWSLLLDGGHVSLAGLYTYLSATGLFQARHAGQSNADFIVSIYDHALGRNPTAAELTAAKSQLDTGTVSRVGFLQSLGEAQTEIGLAPGGGRAEEAAYASHQTDGQVLGRGRSLADTANSASGEVVTTHASAELASIEVAPNGVALHCGWKRGKAGRGGARPLPRRQAGAGRGFAALGGGADLRGDDRLLPERLASGGVRELAGWRHLAHRSRPDLSQHE